LRRVGNADRPADAAAKPGRPRACIVFEQVRFSYPRAAQPVLDQLDLAIPMGRSLAIVGDNGAGKTTLVKLLGRYYTSTAGTISRRWRPS
jgi:ABC-type bacteriocin/lantibiotic exporter with double-glycine peptidase domain